MSVGKVLTVLGPVDPQDLGVVLPHEHLFLQLDNWFVSPQTEEERIFSHSPITMENLAAVRYRPYSHWDNIRIDDQDTVLAEVAAFKRVGGGTIVDLTPPAIGRNPEGLRAVAERTGVRVVAGCGYYVQTSHPPEVAAMEVEQLAEAIIAELQRGIGNTGVRPGVIGEIGTTYPISRDERKVLQGAALAHRRTGAPISVHLSSADLTYAHDVLDILEEAGTDLVKVALGHLDGSHPIDAQAHSRIAARGAYVEYDIFGSPEFSEDGLWLPPPSDHERIDAALALWEAGHGERLLLSHDVCTKMQQRAYGGFGFAHLPGHVAPLMRVQGIPDENIETMLVRNPARWLTWGQAAE